MTQPLRSESRTLALICLALAGPVGVPAHAVSSSFPQLPSLYSYESQLSEAPADPLLPFQLTLGSSVQALQKVARVDVQGYLRAKDDVYLHVTLPGMTESLSALPSEAGLDVLEGDFFFEGGKQLVEASLLVRDERGHEHAIDALQRQLGRPEFEVVLPGALNLVVGFRTGEGFLLCTFDDLPFFRISAFRNDPQDLMAGSQMLLFEGLADYASRLRAGESQGELMRALLSVVTQASMARSLLKPM